MRARTTRQRPAHGTRLLVIDPDAGTLRDSAAAALTQVLGPSDLVVINDAATVPASLAARNAAGDRFEVRLARQLGRLRWQALLLGSGDWRTPTEERPAPPHLMPGAVLQLGEGTPALSARVVAHDARSIRLVTLELAADPHALSSTSPEANMWAAIYAHGRPIQYAYAPTPLPLASVQSPFASRPWSMEPPSAGFSVSAATLHAWRKRGVGLAHLTHGASLSATGDPALDAALPLAERYDIPSRTVAAIGSTRLAGGRVIALGTTVVRALESAALSGAQRAEGLASGEGVATLRLDASFLPRVVDGLLSGVHLPGDSHFDLLSAFAPPSLLRRAATFAQAHGYQNHEFGDVYLVLPKAPRTHAWRRFGHALRRAAAHA